MPKKFITRICSTIILYIAFSFPIRLLEYWFMEDDIFRLLFIWGIPLILAIAVVAVISWVWDFFKDYKNEVESTYQPQSSSNMGIPTIIQRVGGLKYELNTANRGDRLLEATVPIQTVRFTKPADKMIRRDDSLPVILECERVFWKRFRNKLLFVPKPRIIVKSFTEKGIKWDEENTGRADIFIEFYPK